MAFSARERTQLNFIGHYLLFAGVLALALFTRHNAHAGQVLAALRAGKHVFCEKPLCLTLDELDEIAAEARQRPEQLLMAGFNRRFAPQVVKIKALLTPIREPKAFVMTVNAGHIPRDHWTQDPAIGGGRIIGEACHFIDLLRHLAGEAIIDHRLEALGNGADSIDDRATITLRFADGSVGTIHYLANGHKGFPSANCAAGAGPAFAPSTCGARTRARPPAPRPLWTPCARAAARR